ncbi:XkdQ/YqbQ family protein [Anaerovorax odorimutans]|uniref:XkdQ/YqbQ family protein n=1 Tax=Anaerovorax odorimutans TaxID=109327 RepID=UPI000401DA7B|nr:hypothetical protein [Anaerovorax odorimutans]
MVDNYKLMLFKNDKQYNITSMIGDLSWRDSMDTLGIELTFNKAQSDEKYMKGKDIVELGNKLILTNNKTEIFRGIITDEDIQGKTGRSYTAYDYMFYLNKSKLKPIQINKETVTGAITRLSQLNGLQIYSIPQINIQVSKIYKDNTLAEIFNDLLERAIQETGNKYITEMYQGKLYIADIRDLIVTAKYKPASNLAGFDVTKAMGNISKQRNIQDMRNSIVVTSNEESNMSVYAEVNDGTSINNYGLLQETISAESKDMPQANNIAQNKLKELNNIAESTSITLLGNDLVKSGRILKIEEPITKLSGNYLVKDCSHSYSNRVHTMDLTIESVVI